MKTLRQQGFTLIEVMIALTIFAVTATVISDVSMSNVDSYLHFRDKTLASMVAENKLTEVRLGGFPSAGEKKETVTFAQQEWFVLVDTEDVQSEQLKNYVKVVEVKVAKDESRDAFLINVVTYIGNSNDL